jgi:hypothetical protein
MADASFLITQNGVPGPVDTARRDIEPFSVAGTIEFVAQTGGLTYQWELIQPPGGSAVLNNPTSQTASVDAELRGGYLIRLTTSPGLPNEDVLTLYFGMPMNASGAVLPALNETTEDNSLGTPELGWWEKMYTWFEWAEDYIESDLIEPGLGDVYVDITNGDDATGDGSPSKPYQHLDYAMGTVSIPTTLAEFTTPCRFLLAPGDYPEDVVVPRRVEVVVTGDNYIISGKITWNYDPDDWDGNHPSVYTNKLKIGCVTAQSSTLTGDAVDSIAVEAQNVNPGGGTGATPGGDFQRNLELDGMNVLGNIFNRASGDNDRANSTGRLNLSAHLTVCSGDTIGGQVENLAAEYARNPVSATFSVSQVASRLLGCLEFVLCKDTFFGNVIDYSLDPVTGAGSYPGSIGGRQAVNGWAFQNCLFRDSIPTLKFGLDAAQVPFSNWAQPVGMDTYSFNSAINKHSITGSKTRLTFDNIQPTPVPLLEPFFSLDDGHNDSVINVATGDGGDPGMRARAFLAAYDLAKTLLPGGSALSETNRAKVVVPPGQYYFEGAGFGWEHDTDFIDVVVPDGVARRNNFGVLTPDAIQTPMARFYHNAPSNHILRLTASDTLIRGILFDQVEDGNSAVSTYYTGAEYAPFGGNVKMIDCAFLTGNSAAPNPVALRHTGVGFDGYLENCHADYALSGNDTGTRLQGKWIKCTGGDLSYGGTGGGNECRGYFEDCQGGENSFGGTTIFHEDAVAIRCDALGDSFGAGSTLSECKGTCIDCTVVNGNGFGAASTQTPTAGAKLVRCEALKLSSPIPLAGLMDRCVFKQTASLPVVLVDTGAKLIQSRFQLTGAHAFLIESRTGSPASVGIARCSMNVGTTGALKIDVVNVIGNGHNVVDPNFVVD